MADDPSDDDIPTTEDDLLEEMYGNRAALMEALTFFKGATTTGNIKRKSDIPDGSVYDLLQRFVLWGLVEKHAGKGPGGRGGNSDLYELTPKGEIISESVVADDEPTIDDVMSLEERVERLESLREDVESLREDYQTVLAEVRRVRSLLDDDVSTNNTSPDAE